MPRGSTASIEVESRFCVQPSSGVEVRVIVLRLVVGIFREIAIENHYVPVGVIDVAFLQGADVVCQGDDVQIGILEDI